MPGHPRSLLAIVPLALLTSTALSFAEAWDVTDTGQPYQDVEFTLEEGTWITVDVSPDGQAIVFDVLGDIYSLPSAGGVATLVHGGPAMQRTASYSPDGRQLAYLSDASGADNLWISNVDGSAPRQVTHETLDLLMGPAWVPGGRALAAAKTPATFPRMYSSEIRLFDLATGAERQLVPPPENKRDVEEAQFSNDGRQLYYTERVHVPAFTYVDANHINYAIKRRDLTTGATEEIAKGYGSATTPQLSPDGKRLAFIRRVKANTVLFVLDLETNEQRPVYDRLSRDLHADFVPHEAYYPRFDWFPDNRHVAIWAHGKIWRIDTETGDAKPIPFTLTARHRITTPARFKHTLAPERFTAHTVRHLAASPDGRTLLFTAVNHVWTKQLPTGTPRRLSNAQAFESEPVFAPDGRHVAWVEWDDEHGSSLKLANADGRRAKTLATSTGFIRQPAFSPDGERLVYRIQPGDKAFGGYRARAGLYWVAASGEASHYVTADGDAPVFSADGQRIYYVRVEYPDETGAVHRLSSCTLDGLDEREHARAPDADTLELRLSPDHRWLAFKERQQYYVMPYRETGTSVEVRAGTTAVPVARLTQKGGYALSWSPDSKALHWTLGPDLYTAQVASHLNSHAPPPTSYASIGLEIESDVPGGAIALTNGRLITMNGDEVIERGTVVVERNRIVAVGPTGEVQVPPGATVIDVEGKTLMPGIIDMHGHIDCCYGTGAMPQKQPTRYAALAFGVTTNYDPYSTDLPSYESDESQRAGFSLGPRWIGSGAVIYGRSQKSDFYYVPLESYDDARNVMLRKRAQGGIVIKSYKQPTRRQRQQLVKAGREVGVMVDVEGEGHYYNDISIILDGHTILEHNLPVAEYHDDIVELMRRSQTANTPVLNVAFGELFGENYLYQTTRPWDDPKIRTFVQEVNSAYSPLDPPYGGPPYMRGMTTIHVADELWEIGFRSVARSTKKLDDAGVVINVGSHGQIAGLGEHWEMWMLAEGGMSNHRVLRAATINGAKSLGLDAEIGSLEPGKLADLIVLDGDPLTDIRATNTVRYTMLNGRLYDSATMNEIGNHPRKRTRFYWEAQDNHGIDWNEAWSGQ